MRNLLTGLVAAIVLVAAPALSLAAPKFPPLTGRVVDNANVLSPATEQDLTGKLQQLEDQTRRQLVVVTVPDLQGYEIEDYGYQLGRTWGIGSKEDDDGALFIVAPKERKVRIEVGYGLEPILTDALSSTILQTAVIPKFKQGDMEGGIVAGTDAIIDQLAAPDGEARAAVTNAATKQRAQGHSRGFPFWAIFLVIFFFFMMLGRIGRRGRRRSGLGGAIPWIILGEAMSHRGRGGGGGGWGGGGGFGGGGFSGGGGSFGGGGSSGSW